MDPQELCDLIKHTLPQIEEAKLQLLVQFLINQGVKKEKDLRHFTVAMLQQHLDLVDASDLYEEWQNSTSINPRSRQEASCSNNASTASRNPLSTIQMSARSQLAVRLPSFDVQSNLFPADVRAALLARRRSPGAGRVKMVERIIDHCREHVAGFQRSNCHEIALTLVDLYPDSFKDVAPVSRHGSDSLRNQLLFKYDNEKRPHKPTAQERIAPPSKEAYGCQMFDPPMPERETMDSLSRKRDELITMFNLSKKDWEVRIMRRKMEETFYLQRKDIISFIPKKKSQKRKRNENEENEDVPNENQIVEAGAMMPEMKANWPFLFTGVGMNVHFKILTGVDFFDKFTDFVRINGSNYIEYLSSKREDLAKLKRKMRKAERNGFGYTSTVAFLLMLLKYFGDEPTSLVRLVERTTTFDDLEVFDQFPDDRTPVLVAAGPSLYDFDRLFVSIDNTFVTTVANVSEGFTVLFSSYFVFNIVYSEGLLNLLNFTQRVIAEISEPKGSKCPNASMNRRSNDKVVKLTNKFALYMQTINEEENEED